MMTNNEEIEKILRLVEEKKLTVEEAVQLLNALEEGEDEDKRKGFYEKDHFQTANGNNRWLRIRVTDSDSGRSRLNIRIPVTLISAGIKMGMKLNPEIPGVDPEKIVQFIEKGEIGQVVDISDEVEGEHVEIYVE